MELPYFTKELCELSNYIDWWMYVLKNLANMDHLPEALRNQIFESLFLKAEIAKLSKEERKRYNRSLKKMRDMNIIVADRERKITLLSRDIEALSRDNAALSRDKAALSRNIEALSRDNANKDRRIAELERKVRNNSQDINKLN